MQNTLGLLLICLPVGLVNGQEVSADEAADHAQVEAAVKSYVTAFNSRDAEKLASLWSPDGVYRNRSSDEQIAGREAIAAAFAETFAEGVEIKLAAATEAIEFVSPSVALESGSATVTRGDDVSVTRYSAVYVKQDGSWLIDRVSEDETPVATPQYEHLKVLAPLVGEWSFQGEEVAVEVDCRWTKNKNFISRTYKIHNREQDKVESSGLQIIGWDAKDKEIRSWLFDSDGGFVRGEWAQRDGDWVVSSVATLADGGSGSYTTVLRPLEDGNLSWRKINQVVDGQLLPNLDEIIFARK